jgi:polyhydroxyalkanoate synthesis repressor PhaR
MVLIKRYPNRKLYDTEIKQYIKLEGIADLIRQGREVQVIDHSTGEDLTTVILTQIIFEQEKKQAGFVPQSVLTGLVQAGGHTLGSLRRALASPLDLLRQIDEEIERRIQVLISRGELAEEEALRLRDQLLAQKRHSADAPEPGKEELERILADRGVPTRQDMQKLVEQIEALNVKLEEMSK